MYFQPAAKYRQGNAQQSRLTRRLGEMIAIDLRPFSTVENEGFQAFVHELDPRFDIPSRRTMTDVIIPTIRRGQGDRHGRSSLSCGRGIHFHGHVEKRPS